MAFALSKGPKPETVVSGLTELGVDRIVPFRSVRSVVRWEGDRIPTAMGRLRRVARKLVEARRISPITTTQRLAELVRAAIPKRPGPPEKIDPATRTFMALRMRVNQELENLEALLRSVPEVLHADGRFAVISFHSMEDRLVKQAFRGLDESGRYEVMKKKPITPGEGEVDRNPRSRSAKMRVVRKL